LVIDEVRFTVEGYPPAKNEALSLGAGHSHSARVVDLLRAAQAAVSGADFLPFEGPIGLDVLLFVSGADPWDATNYLGGIGDVLEEKGRRGSLDHLGDLATVALYRNDRQIREVRFREETSTAAGYEVRVYRLDR
jgi:hypothetical protein